MFLWPHRDFTQFADDGGIAFIGGMHGHRAIAQHGFGPRRGDGDVIARLAQGDVPFGVLFDIVIGGPARERVFEVPHMAVNLDILDLEVGDRGFEMRIPVHQPLAAIDEALVVKIDEDADYGVVEIPLFPRRGIRGAGHGEGLAVPVAGTAEALELADDGAAGFPLLLPHAAGKGVAAHLAARGFAVLRHFAFGHHLGGDPGMVGARLPERIVPLHAVPACQDILQGVVEGVAHMERARHIGRGDHHAEAFGAGSGVRPGTEGPGFKPFRGDPRLGLGGVEGLFHRHRMHPLQSGGF